MPSLDQTHQTDDLDTIQTYLTLLFPDPPDDMQVVVSWLTNTSELRSDWFLATHLDRVAQALQARAEKFHTYVGLGLRHPQCHTGVHVRGGSADVCAIGGLWIELDHNAGVHTAPNLPTPDQLYAFIADLPFQPSLLIDSGGGIHLYVLFKELWLLTSEDEHRQAALLLKRFQRSIKTRATDYGWHIDSTSDLARILRPPGTWNHKHTPPHPVTILAQHADRYNPSDLSEADWLIDVDAMDTDTPTPRTGNFPLSLIAPIEAGCAWMRHCRDDAVTLPEPHWYGMLSILGRCEDGEHLAHTWSAPFKTARHAYTPQETTEKLQQALTAAGPQTCAYIRYELHGEPYCRVCPSWGKIKSPIVLGVPPKLEFNLDTPIGFQSTHPSPSMNGQHATGALPDIRQTGNAAFRDTLWFKQEVLPFQQKKGILVDANNTTICAFLRNHPYWQGHFWWNDLANKPMYDEEELSDHLITQIGATFGKEHHVAIRSNHILARCLIACCYEHRRDPLQDYLDQLPGWDMEPRLETWLMDCGGVVNTAYHRFVSRMLIVSMIARAYEPGCIYRWVMVLEGPEEFRKSSFVAAMVPRDAWRLSLTASFESKDIPMLIAGVWVAELTELDSLTRTEETRLKAFISDTTDPYVPKYALFRVSPRRRTIFVGTTNESNWLKSPTGNTRFFPVKILHPMDVEAFVAIREQLYAEAKAWYYDHREHWWMIPSEVQTIAGEEREERRQVSVYEADLSVWLTEGRFTQARNEAPDPIDGAWRPVENETTWREIARYFLGMKDRERWSDMLRQKQVAQALKALHWRQKVGAHGRVWVYEPPAPF